MHSIMSLNPNDILNFIHHPLRLSGRQVNFVEYSQNLKTLINSGVTVGNGLSLNSLRRINN